MHEDVAWLSHFHSPLKLAQLYHSRQPSVDVVIYVQPLAGATLLLQKQRHLSGGPLDFQEGGVCGEKWLTLGLRAQSGLSVWVDPVPEVVGAGVFGCSSCQPE